MTHHKNQEHGNCPTWRKAFCLLVIVVSLPSCTLFHTPETYLPQRSGVVPGDVTTVANNQNAYAFAQEHSVSLRELIVLNGLKPPYELNAGQSLVLPYNHGGASTSGASPTALPPLNVTPSMLLGLGSPVQSESLPPIESQPLSPPRPQQGGVNVLGKTVPSAPLESLNAPTPQTQQVATTLSPPTAAAPIAPTTTAASITDAPNMIWPVKGPVLSTFGPKGQGVNNDGVNIGAPKGSPVVAAAGGNVVYAGDEMKGFGNMILIRHEGGWVTAYAHLDRVLVNKDAIVAQGDMIGTVGKTGNISSPQLHFEVREGGKAVDPNEVVKQ